MPPHRWMWYCKCDCGVMCWKNAPLLRRGVIKSCGCLIGEFLRKTRRTHGYSATPTYASWIAMLRRCNDEKGLAYSYYGGRGIKVCDRWKSFENFLADMGERPDKTSLDRIDSDGNYEPTNCRWSDLIQQGRNKRNTVYVSYQGEDMTLQRACELAGLSIHAGYGRMKKKKSPFFSGRVTYKGRQLVAVCSK